MLFDVDGTLLDTNYLHVHTWWQALQEGGYHEVAKARIHQAVGIGSAGLVDHLTGEQNQQSSIDTSSSTRPTRTPCGLSPCCRPTERVPRHRIDARDER